MMQMQSYGHTVGKDFAGDFGGICTTLIAMGSLFVVVKRKL